MLGEALLQAKAFRMPATVAIGRLEFDPVAGVLYDGRGVVPLAPLPAQILATLRDADGDVVSAAQMRAVLWNDAPVEDRNLNQQIYVLRRALRREPRITIENVPRRGYRLVVAPPVAENAPLNRPQKGRLALLSAACALVLVVVVTIVQGLLHRATAAADQELTLGNYLAMSEGPDHLDRASRYSHDVIDRVPTSGAAYGGLAMTDARIAIGYAGSRRTQFLASAKREALIALQSSPKDGNALTTLGVIAAMQDRRTGDAIRFFNAAVAADPLGELPRAWRGKYLLSTGDFDDAGRDFRTLSQNVPTSAYAVGLFGEWLVLNHDYARAIPVLAQALALGNHPGFTRYWLARAYLGRGLDANALRLSNVLLGMYPNEVSALVIRLRVETRHGDARDARADFRQIESTKDVTVTDLVGLASAELAMGNGPGAVQLVRRYLASGNHDIDTLARLRTDPDLDQLRHRVGSDGHTPTAE
jgi:DNA-binding winged helix-turn-helix (wHTH) protein/predicted Zn-dependent protease